MTSAAPAQAPLVQRIDVLDAGIFEVDITGRTGTDHGPADVLNTLENARLVSRATAFPVRLCLTFGFRYRIEGAPRGDPIPLRMITRFPASGLTNPHTGRNTRELETMLTRIIGRTHIRAYTLEHRWELIPGTWTLEIWQGRRQLASRSFVLTGRCRGDCGKDDHAQCTQHVISFLNGPKASDLAKP